MKIHTLEVPLATFNNTHLEGMIDRGQAIVVLVEGSVIRVSDLNKAVAKLATTELVSNCCSASAVSPDVEVCSICKEPCELVETE